MCICVCIGQREISGLTDFFCEGPGNSHFRLYWPCGLPCNYSTVLCGSITVVNNMYIKEHNCVPIKCYLQTLEIEFHGLFMCHEILFVFCRSSKNVESILSLRSLRKSPQGIIAHGAVVCNF